MQADEGRLRDRRHGLQGLIPALLQKKLDAVVSQTKPLPERKEKVLFGRPVLFNPDSYVVPEAKNYTFTPEG